MKNSDEPCCPYCGGPYSEINDPIYSYECDVCHNFFYSPYRPGEKSSHSSFTYSGNNKRSIKDYIGAILTITLMLIFIIIFIKAYPYLSNIPDPKIDDFVNIGGRISEQIFKEPIFP